MIPGKLYFGLVILLLLCGFFSSQPALHERVLLIVYCSSLCRLKLRIRKRRLKVTKSERSIITRSQSMGDILRLKGTRIQKMLLVKVRKEETTRAQNVMSIPTSYHHVQRENRGKGLLIEARM